MSLYLRTAIPGLSAGIVVHNMGGDVTYDQVPQKIPMVYRGGIAYRLHSAHSLFTLDVVKSLDTDYNLNFGAEYIFQKHFLISRKTSQHIMILKCLEKIA